MLFRSYFQQLPLSIIKLYEKEQKTAFLVYRPLALSDYLNREESAELMRQFGYEDNRLVRIVDRFSRRYEDYMNHGGKYPHEIGLFLGYPAEDVIGFITNQGKNYAYSGYWKVYGNVAEAILRFRSFDKAKEAGIHMLHRGMTIQEMVK